jgi:hypothetical protein
MREICQADRVNTQCQMLWRVCWIVEWLQEIPGLRSADDMVSEECVSRLPLER